MLIQSWELTMGLRFRKSFRIVPGVRVNLGLGGFTGISVGRRGATMNFGKRGTTGTVSVPGTGLSYQHRFSKPPNSPAVPPTQTARSGIPLAVCFIVAVMLVGGYLGSRAPSFTPTSPVEQSASAPTAIPNLQLEPAPVSALSSKAPSDSIRAGSSDARPVNVMPVKEAVTTTVANVRAAPSMSGAIVRTLPKGTSVQVLQADNGWLQVGQRDGEALGWVRASLLK
jgi:hypothetical protein